MAAHVANNPVTQADLPALIQNVHSTLTSLGELPAPLEDKRQPAVPIKRSITPDYLMPEDGERLKSMKRHLMTAYG